jgi:hypothetical protein
MQDLIYLTVNRNLDKIILKSEHMVIKIKTKKTKDK